MSSIVNFSSLPRLEFIFSGAALFAGDVEHLPSLPQRNRSESSVQCNRQDAHIFTFVEIRLFESSSAKIGCGLFAS
jgi:hypothetical protein